MSRAWRKACREAEQRGFALLTDVFRDYSPAVVGRQEFIERLHTALTTTCLWCGGPATELGGCERDRECSGIRAFAEYTGGTI